MSTFVFLPKIKEVRHDVMRYAMTYDFVLAKDWWGINKMPLNLGVDKIVTIWTSHFSFCV